MLPIFNEYRGMLKEFGVNLSQYDEDKLWIDRLIIRGISKNGEIKKICRLKVTDELEYEYKFYSDIPKNEELETWEETYLSPFIYTLYYIFSPLSIENSHSSSIGSLNSTSR